jgi:hypothetical protein
MARPSKLTPETQKKLCDALAGGATRADAALFAGLEVSSFYRWLRQGKAARRGAVCQFYHAVKAAEAAVAVRCTARVQAATLEDWKAAAWWLERRRPRQFATKAHLDVDARINATVTVHHVSDFYPPPERAPAVPADASAAGAVQPGTHEGNGLRAALG